MQEAVPRLLIAESTEAMFLSYADLSVFRVLYFCASYILLMYCSSVIAILSRSF